ncbi:DMT family transporter [Tabrizicola sp. DMG-N-6]|uniref:DMT family transporter n=2 Tax=Szabonella alba TaxID=2804194 RepID=A0A8K0XYL7_9RHOB|nr:DMT family transporter [Szabonella alba]
MVLLVTGFGWGLTQPLGKIAVSTGHGHFGLIFWHTVVCTVVLGFLALAQGRPLPITRAGLKFALVVAVLGTIVPNTTFYLSIARLPSGVMSILISMVPLLSFPMALALGMDRFSARRVIGLLLGLGAVALIALPGTSLPDPAMVAFLPLALIAPLFYAMEGNYVALKGTAGLDAVQAMFLASVIGMVISLPLALGSGQFISPVRSYGLAEAALIGSAAIHALAYVGYVWLAARAGAVFAAQCSYIVTASGVIWAMILLGERFSPFLWAAMAVMLAGLSLVRPRRAALTGAPAASPVV